MGRFTPCLSGSVDCHPVIVVQVVSVHRKVDGLRPARDPVVGIRGREERHANLNLDRVGGVLDEGGCHEVSPVDSLIIQYQGSDVTPETLRDPKISTKDCCCQAVTLAEC